MVVVNPVGRNVMMMIKKECFSKVPRLLSASETIPRPAAMSFDDFGVVM